MRKLFVLIRNTRASQGVPVLVWRDRGTSPREGENFSFIFVIGEQRLTADLTRVSDITEGKKSLCF